MRYFVFLLLVCFVSKLSSQDFPSWSANLSGANLKEAVRINCSPSNYVNSNQIDELILDIDLKNDSVLSRFSLSTYSLSQAKSGLTPLWLVPSIWYRNASKIEKEHATSDLFNIFPAEIDFANIREDYMPGTPVEAYWSNGIITIGPDEHDQGVWTFPDKFRGEFARTFFYMATVYPMDLWGAYGQVFMADGSYPSLSKNALEMLLEFHDNYPPSEEEIQRNRLIEKIQGNINVFVTFPEMISHIWGDKKNMPFPGASDENNETGEHNQYDEKYDQLRGYYSINDIIWLKSPFIPHDAIWTVDGTTLNSESINASDLQLGKHLLEFKSSSLTGKLFIEISQ